MVWSYTDQEVGGVEGGAFIINYIIKRVEIINMFPILYVCIYLGPYHLFAGKDASVALAKMSFLPEDVASTDISSLTAEQKQTLQEWDEKFLSKRKYPVVGTIIGSNTSGNEALKQ